MSNRTSSAKSSTPVSLLQKADDNPGVFRIAMQSSISFTGISGEGHVLVGIPALAVTGPAAQQPSVTPWRIVWMISGILSLAFYLRADFAQLPGIWICLYGAAVMTVGMHAASIIPVMSALCIVLGALVLFMPLPANIMLRLRPGVLPIIFGSIMWRTHGG